VGAPRIPQAPPGEYATPRGGRPVLGTTKQDQKQKIDDIFADVDQDSLDGDCREEDSDQGPDYPDEGLGDPDQRAYYSDDQGLEVILEEPEDDYPPGASHSLRRVSGERRSLEGSEGIGSTEDESSDLCCQEEEEEDCGSSGVHSQDTPSRNTPINIKEYDDISSHRKEDRIQKDRSIDIYPETLRQRQRTMPSSADRVDIKNWNKYAEADRENKSAPDSNYLPSVKALRSQFEKERSASPRSSSPKSFSSGSSSHSTLQRASREASPLQRVSRETSPLQRSPCSSLQRKQSPSSLASSSQDGCNSSTLSSSCSLAGSSENLLDDELCDYDQPIEPIFCQFQNIESISSKPANGNYSPHDWDPRPLLKVLYELPKVSSKKNKKHSYVNIEGYLEKLPSGRKKSTFWNAWKRRYFVAKDGMLYYYPNSSCERASLKLSLMGGKVETMEGNLVGVDDGKGHYVVMRCGSREEADQWCSALSSQLAEDFQSQYVTPLPPSPSLLRDTVIIDIGSSSTRAGLLYGSATLPQLYFPSALAIDRATRRHTWGAAALAPAVRASSSVSYPVRQSHKISKYSMDLNAIASLLSKIFHDLKVDPKNFKLLISVPRMLNQVTQAELLRIIFEKFGCPGVSVMHQAVLALFSYNATSGVVVDIGERLDIVPIIDGYIVEGGVSRIPYGGARIADHLRAFLHTSNVSLGSDVESYLVRHIMERACYCAQHYNAEKSRCAANPDAFARGVSLREFFPSDDACPYERVELDFGRFQAPEGLFHPEAWGLDHPGLAKLVHRAIQECSMDARKELARSVYLSGGASLLAGLSQRLAGELDNLTPPSVRPRVHASPHRAHAAYLGGASLALSPMFASSLVLRQDWSRGRVRAD